MPTFTELMKLVEKACQTDDTTLIAQALELAPRCRRDCTGSILKHGLEDAIRHRSVPALDYLLEHGANINSLTYKNLDHGPSKDIDIAIEILNLLIQNGWDINSWDPGTKNDAESGSWPYLWHVIQWPEMVEFCLKNGARVDLVDERIQLLEDGSRSGPKCFVWPLLDIVAESGTVAQFEFFRDRGAPLGYRMLNNAVRKLTSGAINSRDQGHPWFQERMQMIRHLVKLDEVDVDSMSVQPGDLCYTPLAFLASEEGTSTAYKEVISLLLDAGANPDLRDPSKRSPMEYAELYKAQGFIKIVESWRSEHSTKQTPT